MRSNTKTLLILLGAVLFVTTAAFAETTTMTPSMIAAMTETIPGNIPGTTGLVTPGQCINIDSNGNYVDKGRPCPTDVGNIPGATVNLVPQAAATVTAPAGATAVVPQPNGTVVFLYPIIHDLEPYVVLALGTIITGLGSAFLAIGFAYLKSRWNIDVDQNTRDKVAAQLDLFRKSATTQAGAWIAQAEPGWRDLSIDAKHPWIADAANKVIARLPAEAASIGMTPQKLADMIAGEIGNAQKAFGPTPVSPVITQTTPEKGSEPPPMFVPPFSIGTISGPKGEGR